MTPPTARSIAEILAAPPPGPLVTVADGYYSIETGWGRYNYDIERCMIASEKDIVGWLRQLLEKNWFTARHAKDFLEVACGELKIERRSI